MIKNVTKSLFCVAIGAVALSSCSSDAYDADAAKQEFATNFEDAVMDGKAIDANQTWNTSTTSTINVSVNLDYGESYTVKIYTDNPIQNKDASYIGITKLTSGESATLTVARPTNATNLFAACYDKSGNYTVELLTVDSNNTASVAFGTANTKAISKSITRTTVQNTSTDRASYLQADADTYFVNDIDDYSNNYTSYYDLSKVSESDYTQLGAKEYLAANNYSGTYKYGDGLHFVVPANATITGNLTNQSTAGATIVVKGTWTIPSLSDAKKFDNGQFVVIAKGGKLITNSDIEVTNTSRIVNFGTIETNGHNIKFTNESDDKAFYNSSTGTITLGSGSIIIAGNSAKYYNAGTITTNNAFEINGTFTLTNVGHITAASTKANDITLDGQKSAGSNAKIINLCNMSIGSLGVNHYIGCDGSFLDATANNGIFVNAGGEIVLGKQAMIKATNWSDNGGKYYGSSTASEYSVFKFTGSVTETAATSFDAQGYIYFDGTFPTQAEVDAANKNGTLNNNQYKLQHPATIAGLNNTYISAVNSIKYFSSETTNSSTKTIATSDCNGSGYNPGGGGDDDNTSSYVYYAFEDLGSTDDFDFNDVVLRVSAPNTRNNSTVELCAAGGTLPTTVYCGDTQLGSEVHTAFNVSTSTMVNTTTVNKDFVKIGTITGVGLNGTTASTLDMKIKVQDGSSSREVGGNESTTGNVPLMIRINGNDSGKWFWATERTNISDAYTSFGAWGASYTSSTDWYKTPTSGKVVSY